MSMSRHLERSSSKYKKIGISAQATYLRSVTTLLELLLCLSHVMRKPCFCFAYAKTKALISFAVTAKLISAFVSATWIVQYLYFLNKKFQVSSHLLWLHSPVYVGPGRKPRRQVFSRRGSILVCKIRCCIHLLWVHIILISVYVTAWPRFGKELFTLNRIFALYYSCIFHYCFYGRNLVMIVLVPGHCLPLSFI